MKLTSRSKPGIPRCAAAILALSLSTLTGVAGARASTPSAASTVPPAAVPAAPTGGTSGSPGPDDSKFRALVDAAESARQSGDQARAIDLYRQAVQLRPVWPDGWWFLGSLEYAASDYAGARDALTHFIDLNPPAGPATALRGLCEFEIGEYPVALRDIQSGLAHGAANQARNERILRAHEALLLTRNGHFEDALRTYSFFAHDGAPDPQMAAGIGLAGLRNALLPADLAPDQRELFISAGNAIFQFIAGDPAGAKQAFEAVFLRYPAVPNLHYVYGYYLFVSDPDEAAAEFRRELEVSPRSAATEAILAWAAIMHNDPAGARPYAQRAVADDPSLPLAQLVLGRAMVEGGELGEGTAHLEQALQLDPANIENHLALARAYSEAGRKADAYRQRQESLAMTKDEAIAHP